MDVVAKTTKSQKPKANNPCLFSAKLEGGQDVSDLRGPPLFLHCLCESSFKCSLVMPDSPIAPNILVNLWPQAASEESSCKIYYEVLIATA